MLWGAVEEDPVIGRGSGVKKVVVGGWGQEMGACHGGLEFVDLRSGVNVRI